MRRHQPHVVRSGPAPAVVVRHRATGRYLAGGGRWVSDPDQALAVAPADDVGRVAELASCEAGPVDLLPVEPRSLAPVAAAC